MSIPEKLDIYAWAAQGAYGNNKTPEPSVWEIVQHMKWTAWMGVKGMSKEEAKRRYVEHVESYIIDKIN